MTTTRRAFLIGLGAAVAASQMPFTQALGFEAEVPYVRRAMSLCDIAFEHDGADRVAHIRIGHWRPLRYPTELNYSMNQRSLLLWRAMPREEMIFTPQHMLRIDVTGEDIGVADIRLIVTDKYRDGTQRGLQENYRIKDNKLIERTTNFLAPVAS